MSTQSFKIVLTILLGTGLALATASARPDDITNGTPMIKLSPGAAEVIKLHQAKIGDDTILAYISTAGTGYALDADQIIYLQQQGISSAIITAMLNQGRPGTTAAATAPQAALLTGPTVGTSTVATAPAVPYVQPAPAPTYYYPAPATYYYDPYYYPAYYGPPVSIGIGWGWGWGGRGGWHGGRR